MFDTSTSTFTPSFDFDHYSNEPSFCESFDHLCLSHSEALMVRIWPCNDFAIVEDICCGDYDHKSDDYQDVNINNMRAFNKLDLELQIQITEAVFG